MQIDMHQVLVNKLVWGWSELLSLILLYVCFSRLSLLAVVVLL